MTSQFYHDLTRPVDGMPKWVRPEHRFTEAHPCPICGGHQGLDHGIGQRCYGFRSDDGRFAFCTREEHAGRLTMIPGSNTYTHHLNGFCGCGKRHDLDNQVPTSRVADVPHEAKIVATYDYRAADVTLLFQVVRYAPKRFRQRRPDGAGGWIWNLNGIRPVLYRLPELIAADPTEPVFIVEGEKDVDTLVALGLVATCSPMGAGKWLPAYNRYLRGRRVVILPDNDAAGRAHATQIANGLLSMSEEEHDEDEG